jgi:hypothetical protein
LSKWLITSLLTYGFEKKEVTAGLQLAYIAVLTSFTPWFWLVGIKYLNIRQNTALNLQIVVFQGELVSVVNVNRRHVEAVTAGISNDTGILEGNH